MAVYFGEIETFPSAKPDKAQVMKILEECAEVYSAWESLEGARCDPRTCNCRCSRCVLDECADVVQAVANLVAAIGVHNFTFFVEECERRNRKRGRYEPGA